MKISHHEWVEITAQLRHRIEIHKSKAPYLFRGLEVDDIIQEVVKRFLKRSRPEIDSAGLVRLLVKMAKDFVIDEARHSRHNTSLEEIPPQLSAYISKPWLKILVDRIVSNARGEDQAFWNAFRKLASGSMAKQNQQVSEELNVTAAAVSRFKQRAKKHVSIVIAGSAEE